MPDTPKVSEARRALLEKYLHGGTLRPAQSAELNNSVAQSATIATDNSSQAVTSFIVEERPVQNSLVEQESNVSQPVPAPRERAVVIQAGDRTKRPFFYLHGDWKGQAFYCFPLARALGEDQPFYVLEPYDYSGLPGPPPYEEVAAAHVKSMRAVQPEGPYLLGGWCNGGLLAYEMARQLDAVGQRVALLVLVDADYPAPRIRRLFRRLIVSVCTLLRLGPEQPLNWFLFTRHIYRLLRFKHYRREKPIEVMELLAKETAKHDGKRAASAWLKWEVLFPSERVLREDWPGIYEWMGLGYEPPDIYPGKIVFLWDEVDLWRRVGWREIVAIKDEQTETCILPGSHISCRTDYLHVFAERLREYISRAQSIG